MPMLYTPQIIIMAYYRLRRAHIELCQGLSLSIYSVLFIVLLRRDSYVAMSLGYKQIITRALGMYSGILVLHWWLSPCASVMLYIYIPRAHVITSYNIISYKDQKIMLRYKTIITSRLREWITNFPANLVMDDYIDTPTT